MAVERAAAAEVAPMKILATPAVAAVILFFLDQAFNYGHYSDAVLTLLRQIGRSFGIR